jgi:hypothetical protein
VTGQGRTRRCGRGLPLGRRPTRGPRHRPENEMPPGTRRLQGASLATDNPHSRSIHATHSARAARRTGGTAVGGCRRQTALPGRITAGQTCGTAVRRGHDAAAASWATGLRQRAAQSTLLTAAGGCPAALDGRGAAALRRSTALRAGGAAVGGRGHQAARLRRVAAGGPGGAALRTEAGAAGRGQSQGGGKSREQIQQHNLLQIAVEVSRGRRTPNRAAPGKRGVRRFWVVQGRHGRGTWRLNRSRRSGGVAGRLGERARPWQRRHQDRPDERLPPAGRQSRRAPGPAQRARP